MSQDKEEWYQIFRKVSKWSLTDEEYSYCNRKTLYGLALKKNMITQEEYEIAEKEFGELWEYTGD